MNNPNYDNDTPLWQLTLGEFIECMKKQLPSPKEVVIPKQEKYSIRGLKGLAKLLGVSYSQAWRIKNSNDFSQAYIQRGRVILFNKEKVLELFENRKFNNKK